MADDIFTNLSCCLPSPADEPAVSLVATAAKLWTWGIAAGVGSLAAVLSWLILLSLFHWSKNL